MPRKPARIHVLGVWEDAAVLRDAAAQGAAAFPALDQAFPVPAVPFPRTRPRRPQHRIHLPDAGDAAVFKTSTLYKTPMPSMLLTPSCPGQQKRSTQVPRKLSLSTAA